MMNLDKALELVGKLLDMDLNEELLDMLDKIHDGITDGLDEIDSLKNDIEALEDNMEESRYSPLQRIGMCERDFL